MAALREEGLSGLELQRNIFACLAGGRRLVVKGVKSHGEGERVYGYD